MTHPLANNTARTIIVDSVRVRRGEIARVLRTLGIREIVQVETLAEAEDIRGRMGCDWLITFLEVGSENALQYLASLLQREDGRTVRVSVFTDDAGEEVVPFLFQLGAFTVHRTAQAMQGFEIELRSIWDVGARMGWDDCLIAAHYLRPYLQSLGLREARLALEQALLAIYPEREVLAIELAEAFAALGRTDSAVAVLSRHSFQDPLLADRAEALYDRLKLRADDGRPLSDYGIEHVVAVDPDESVTNQLRSLLSSLGIARVDCFRDGREAWEFLQESSKAPDMVILEWRIPGLGGAALTQRILGQWREAHIIVYSSLLKSKHRLLLRELGVSDLLEKPKANKALQQALLTFLAERRDPTQAANAEARIRQLIGAKRLSDASAFLESALQKKLLPEPLALGLKAEIAYVDGRLADAARLGVEALHLGGEDVAILNLLGKIHLKNREFVQAQKFFDRATELSPDNIERLCQSAETRIEQDDFKSADLMLEQARTIDAESKLIQETDAKKMLAQGDSTGVRQLAESGRNVRGVISFMNNRGIALAKQERFDECIALYQTALQGVPQDQPDLSETISYNLALAFAKADRLSEAQEVLQKVTRRQESPVRAKGRSLLKRVEEALSSGKPVVLNTGLAEETLKDRIKSTTAPQGELPMVAAIEPGEVRLHRVFTAPGDVPPKVHDLLAQGTKKK